MGEQEQCDLLERLCGGVGRATRLQRIWLDTHPTGDPTKVYGRITIQKSKVAEFRREARSEKFSDVAIDLFLTM